MSLRDIFRPLLNLISCRATDVFLGERKRKWWKNQSSKLNLHKQYFDKYLDRVPIIDEIGELIRKKNISFTRIIEFGCSGGNNLKLLRERISAPIDYCGLDIQEDAISFARAQFPDATFYKCADTDLPSFKSRLGHFDIFLVSGVLYYLPQKEAQSVLDFAAYIADHLVAYEDLSRFEHARGENTGLFIHPYGLMLRQIGFEIVTPPHNIKEGDRHGVFIARSPSAKVAL